MKIITWNINGYRSITGQNPSKKYDIVTKENKLFAFIEKENPDILCLQETKADLEQINDDLKYPSGYFGNYHSCTSKKGYSGVVTFSKKEPLKINSKLGIEKFDVEGRIMETHFEEFIILNIYFPKGYADDDRLIYKLEFYDNLFNYINKLHKKNNKIIISGDYNTAHHPIDLARPDQNIGTSGFMPEEREKLDILVQMGFLDVFRLATNEGNHYTWWSQRGRARENNIGWRIDYHFISQELSGNFKTAYHLPKQEGSDHCPVVLEFI